VPRLPKNLTKHVCINQAPQGGIYSPAEKETAYSMLKFEQKIKQPKN